MFNTNIQMPTVKTIISTATSAAAAAMLIRSIARDNVPIEFQDYISNKLRALFASISSEVTIIISEVDGMVKNQLFYAADLYLGTKLSALTHRFRATLPIKESNIQFSMDKNQEVVDIFNGVKLTWKKVTKQVKTKRFNEENHEIQYYNLCFHKKHKDMVFTTYFQHILEQAQVVKKQKRTPKLHTLDSEIMHITTGTVWQSVNLDHPANFGTLAMDMEMKKMIMEDLDRFLKRKDFYRKVGKAWKRGYLLFGPPGTGKSSLIAAMANYLNFDIYDLELTDIGRNSDLRRLLIATANRSILVVEDIDCSIDLQKKMKAHQRNFQVLYSQQGNEMTLSGLLNFMDGLWSSCGDERIIVFTTNHKDRLDPALLRPGRMDLHIHMSYCTQSALRTLSSNYLGITEHLLLTKIEQQVQETKVTPAEVGEQLMKSENSEEALRMLMNFIAEKKKNENLRSTQQKEVAEVGSKEFEEIKGSNTELGIICSR
ncbi:AAA-ATPase At3g50940-like [Chenopodium quinoa]|uniref:AAA+ ATPase domain-containing protein n=1 Tax=Chenopodium quinoa TaxID=63459 RepID=A0A803LP87_CHEQI|nr:AAA-ATPase At3g50940-like [Chenopodium quinoa]